MRRFLQWSIGLLLMSWGSTVHAQMAVIDTAALEKWALQIKAMADQIKTLEAQLSVMNANAALAPGIWNEVSSIFLQQQSALSATNGALGYGASDLDSRVLSATDASPVLDGTWLPRETGRQSQAVDTQRILLDVLHERQLSFDQDQQQLDALQQASDAAIGSDQLLSAQNALIAESIHQQEKTQQLLLTLANSQAVSAAHQTEERAARESQQSAFLTDFDRPLPPVQFKDYGLLDSRRTQ